MNLYIGGLAKEVTQDDLMQVFGAYGQITSAAVIKDKFTGESRGFGFVDMPQKGEAEAAMNAIKEIKGKSVTINEAQPREPRSGGGGFGGGRRPHSSPRSGRDRRGGGSSWR